jgi:hypothetical protein
MIYIGRGRPNQYLKYIFRRSQDTGSHTGPPGTHMKTAPLSATTAY